MPEMRAGLILAIIRLILQRVMPWLREHARDTDSPIDDIVVDVLCELLDIEPPARKDRP